MSVLVPDVTLSDEEIARIRWEWVKSFCGLKEGGCMKVEIKFKDLELEEDCPWCGGCGKEWKDDVSGEQVEVDCGRCREVGKILTSNGEDAIEFMLRWLKGINR